MYKPEVGAAKFGQEVATDLPSRSWLRRHFLELLPKTGAPTKHMTFIITNYTFGLLSKKTMLVHIQLQITFIAGLHNMCLIQVYLISWKLKNCCFPRSPEDVTSSQALHQTRTFDTCEPSCVCVLSPNFEGGTGQ